MEKLSKTKTLFIIWAIIVVIVLILLTILGFMLKNNNKEYHELEDKLKVSGEKYGNTEFIYNNEFKTLKITTEELENYIDYDLKVNEDECTGYVEVTYDYAYEYKAFISCNNYTTKGYEK